jgi:hypothetical protein
MAHIVNTIISYNVIVGGSEGKRPLGRPNRRLQMNTKRNKAGSARSEYGLVVSFCEHDDEPSGSVTVRGLHLRERTLLI